MSAKTKLTKRQIESVLPPVERKDAMQKAARRVIELDKARKEVDSYIRELREKY